MFPTYVMSFVLSNIVPIRTFRLTKNTTQTVTGSSSLLTKELTYWWHDKLAFHATCHTFVLYFLADPRSTVWTMWIVVTVVDRNSPKKVRYDPIRSRHFKIVSRSDTDPQKVDLDPRSGSKIAIQCTTGVDDVRRWLLTTVSSQIASPFIPLFAPGVSK